MLTIRRTSKTEYANMVTISRRAVSTLIISSVVILGVSGCGQKGDLYLANTNGQSAQSSTAVLDSTSHPQDAAFAGIDDDNVSNANNANNVSTTQDAQDFELPEPSTDPNDY
ncbi:LPS translocon maturation chaperone LptM [Psychrobacter alimentarius]|uniref:LPS translocon maturation chaperone LptM n=1 Tax=Psychrobacter alimentarius TaxID=261164 RepID=UPI003FD038FD